MTHDEARELARFFVGAERERAEELLLYIDQQERNADLSDMRMQRDVFCEKLNEYIDKTKEAEKRAETAEQEVERLEMLVAKHVERVEQARTEGYELGKADALNPRKHEWQFKVMAGGCVCSVCKILDQSPLASEPCKGPR